MNNKFIVQNMGISTCYHASKPWTAWCGVRWSGERRTPESLQNAMGWEVERIFGYVHTHLSPSAINHTQLMAAIKMQVWGKIIFACLPGIQLIIQGCGEQLSLLKCEDDYSFQLFPETLSSPAHDYLLTFPFHPRRFRPGRGFNSFSNIGITLRSLFPWFLKITSFICGRGQEGTGDQRLLY